MDKDSDIYKNRRDVYVNKLNNKDIFFQKTRQSNFMKLNFMTHDSILDMLFCK